MNEQDLVRLIEGCKRQERAAQKRLYQHFYSYTLTICTRYARNSDEAKEILNDAFLRVLTKIDLYTPSLSFVGWLRKIVVHAAIDHYRKYKNNIQFDEIQDFQVTDFQADAIAELSFQDLLRLIRELPPAYQTVFNLYVIEGFNHAEIAELLNISEGTSKSNLHKARQKLMEIIRINHV